MGYLKELLQNLPKDSVYRQAIEKIARQPTQTTLATWLREEHNVMIDMFYESGLWSGRCYRVGDTACRWQSCSTKKYEDTLEEMLSIGLTLIKQDTQ